MAAEKAGRALVPPWEACAVKSSRMGRSCHTADHSHSVVMLSRTSAMPIWWPQVRRGGIAVGRRSTGRRLWCSTGSGRRCPEIDEAPRKINRKAVIAEKELTG